MSCLPSDHLADGAVALNRFWSERSHYVDIHVSLHLDEHSQLGGNARPPNPGGDIVTATRGPLSGLRIIEVSSFVAAPLAGMTLGQLGAEVLRIDPLGGAADGGRWPLTENGASLYWNGLNKGKLSAAIDLRSEDGQRLVHGLVKALAPGTGVLVTNIGSQPWLGYDFLRTLCPDLIHVAVEGNSDGSAAVDYTVNAAMGFPLVTGPENVGGPVNHVLPAWDIACGLYTALGVSAAARQRELTGEGAEMRLSLSDVALATSGNLGFLAEAELNKFARTRIGNHLYGSFARDFRCSDGQSVMVVALTSRHWRDLIRLTGTEEVVSALETALRADFRRDGDRYTHRAVLAALLEPWFAERTRSEAEVALASTSCLAGPYRTFTEVVDSLKSGKTSSPIVTVIDQPGVGSHLVPGLPLRTNPLAAVCPAPILGEHTRDVLSDWAGVDQESYARLVTAGVVAADT
jgi:2-methylfumaryl-CoA isomerase